MRDSRSIPRSVWLGWGFALALTALAVVAAYTYRAYQAAASQLIVERDRQVAFLSASRLKEELGTFSDLLHSIGRLRDVAQGDEATRRAALYASRNRLTVFDGGVVLLDNFGRVVATQPERGGILGSDWSNKPFFRALLTIPSQYFSNVSDDGAFGARVIVVSVPLLGDEGEFVGVLAGMFRLGEPSISSFYASIVKLRLGQTSTGQTYIVDGRNRLLFDSAENRDQFSIGSEVDIQQISGIDIDGAGNAARTRDSMGNDIVVAHAPVPGTEWTLVMEDDWAALSGPMRRYGQLLIGFLAFGMVLTAVGVGLLYRERSTETVHSQQVEQETWIASLIQSALMPKQLPMIPGWNVSIHYRPTTSIGGDFYDLLLLADGRLALAIADVPQIGVNAAVAMATTRAAVRSAARRMLDPLDALASMNEILCAELDTEDSIRCIFSILDPSSGHLWIGLAGHTPPYCSSLGADQMLAQGMPLGVSLEADFELFELDIAPGACIAFFGEGVMQATNARGEALGRDRLLAAMESLAADGHKTADDLIERLQEYLGPEVDQLEDLTIITLEHVQRVGLGS